jgi:hypothetical protein
MRTIHKQFSMRALGVGIVAVMCAAAVAGCKTDTSPGNITAGPVALEFAVGTLNDSAGTLTGTAGTYLNTVASFRGQFGASAFINPGTATLTRPGGLSDDMGQLFSYGQAPGTNFVGGFPPAYAPASQNAAGYATGFMFPIDPSKGTPLLPPPDTSGAYQLKTVVPANGQNQPYAASATLPASPTVLGNYPAPGYASGGATGGGTFTLTVPAGVTETLVVISVNGGAEVATVETKTATATVPAGTLTPTATCSCTYTAFAIGADYPLVEAGPPASTLMRPVLTGANGTSDLTVSAALVGFAQ